MLQVDQDSRAGSSRSSHFRAYNATCAVHVSWSSCFNVGLDSLLLLITEATGEGKAYRRVGLFTAQVKSEHVEPIYDDQIRCQIVIV
jgi:hypothetical protein